MRKLRSLAILTAFLVLFTAGCSSKAADKTNAAGPTAFKDGTYTASGLPDEDGWTPELSITMVEGKITAVTYDEIAAVRKSLSAEYQRTFRENTKNELTALYAKMQENLIKSQDPAAIDSVAGATEALEHLKALAQKALSDAKEGALYKDGDYKATGTADDKGWTPIVAITVKDGKIQAVHYDEVSAMVFKSKSTDTAYIEGFKKEKSIDLLNVYDTLQRTLLEKQAPEKVDAYTGATAAHDRFVTLAAQALQKAGKK